MPTPRDRTVTTTVTKTGAAERPLYNVVTIVSKDEVKVERCVDVVGNYPEPNGLMITKTRYTFPVINGTQFDTLGRAIRKYHHCPITYHAVPPSLIAPTGFPPQMSDEDLALGALRTNPLSADVNLLAFVGELKDFPLLLRQLGLTGIKAFRAKMTEMTKRATTKGHRAELLGELNLAYRFGVAPMVGDLAKMLAFTSLVDKRVAVLRKLQKNGGIKRRFRIEDVTVSKLGPEHITESLLSVFFRGQDVDEYTRRQWATVRWQLRDLDALPKSNVAMRRFATQLVTGFHAHGAIEAMWELVPWSWLIDWFLDVGTWLKRHNNMVPLTPSPACVMTHTSSRRTVVNTQVPGWATVSGPNTATHETKRRTVLSSELADLPQFRMNLLSAGQLSILGSLAITKKVKRIG